MMKLHRIFVLWLTVSSSLAWGQMTSSTRTLVGRPAVKESLFHLHGGLTLLRRHAPTGDTRDANKNLVALGTTFHWQPQSWISFGPAFRGLSSFDSGTDTTRVTNTVNAMGLSVDVFPLSSSLSSFSDLYARAFLGTGVLYSIESITFSHQLISDESLSRTVTSWVFPLEAGGELVMDNITLRASMGYTFFAQSQGIYLGFGFGMLI